MRREFHLPDLGSGLQEGEIVAWRVAVGDTVTDVDVLCEIETEKAVVEIPAPYPGTIVELGAAEGDTIRVGSVLVVIDVADDVDDEESPPREEETIEPAPVEGTPPSPATPRPAGTRPVAMPLVRKLAREHGIDLGTIVGSGVGGRITRRDVERAITAKETSEATAPSTESRIALSSLRRRIAAHMERSWREIPHVFSSIEVDAGRFLDARRILGDRFSAKVPLEALMMLAVVPLLRRHPEFNATLDGDELVLHRRYDIGFAVDTPEGLIVPVIRGVDGLGPRELSARIVELAERTRERKVAPEEVTGGTFTVNNIGALGRASGTSIIPSGTTAIVSFGRALERPVARSGGVVVRPVMSINLAFDHRVIDGGLAVRFLEELSLLVEEPLRFLLP